MPAPYEFFRLTFTQPADHRNARAGTFQQRLTLLHRGTDRPMVRVTVEKAIAVRTSAIRIENCPEARAHRASTPASPRCPRARGRRRPSAAAISAP